MSISDCDCRNMDSLLYMVREHVVGTDMGAIKDTRVSIATEIVTKKIRVGSLERLMAWAWVCVWTGVQALFRRRFRISTWDQGRVYSVQGVFKYT